MGEPPELLSPLHERRAGRRLIAALGTVMILTWGSSIYLLSVLAPFIAEDTGWSQTSVVGSLSVGLLVAGLVSPWVGALVDARGGRPVLIGGCILLAVGLLTIAIAPNLAVFGLGWCVIGAGMAASLYDAAFAALGRLYGAAARRPITSLTLWGGFASTVCWPISAFLAAHLGWRGTCLAYAAVHLCVCVPLVALTLPPIARPAARHGGGETRRAATLSGNDLTAFLLLAGILTLGGTITFVMSVQILAVLQAQGFSLAEAVAAGAVIGPAQVFARVIEQVSGGRHHPLWTMTWAVGLVVSGVTLLYMGFAVVALALAAYGAGNGIFSIAKGTVPLALLGPERYPVLSGRLARPVLLAQALAPFGAAYLLSTSGPGAVMASLVVLAVSAGGLLGALWLLPRAP